MSIRSIAHHIQQTTLSLHGGMDAVSYMRIVREICELSRDLIFEVIDEFDLPAEEQKELSWMLFEASERMFNALQSVGDVGEEDRQLAADFATNVRERSEEIATTNLDTSQQL